MGWETAIGKATDYVVRIDTPTGSGTGYLMGYNTDKTFCAIATAHHVISDAETWQQPIRIYNHKFSKQVFLKESDRVIFSEKNFDSAVILFNPGELGLPQTLIPLRPPHPTLDIGVELGWLGFPGIDPNTLCFFSGNVSARKGKKRITYLVDGVAIHGVSGGPVMYTDSVGGLQFVGVVSAYRVNRQTGEALPGLLIAQDVSHFHTVVQTINSIDEAKAKSEEQKQKSQSKDDKDGTPPTTIPPNPTPPPNVPPPTGGAGQ